MCLRHLANKIRSLFMANPNDFLLNTDYEMDKIVYFKSGEFTDETSFAHNLDFTPLIFGVWSTDADFRSSNTLGQASVDAYVGTPPLSVYTNEKNGTIKIKSRGQDSATTKIYYRIYAFEPPESTKNAPHTSSHAKNFILNTDYNYRKLKKAGVFTSDGEEYIHNLGYYPHVMAWIKYKPDFQDGLLEPFVWASNVTQNYFIITDNKIKVKIEPDWVDKIYWRLYYDET